MTTSAQKWNLFDLINDELHLKKDYRLWVETPIIAGKSIIILVHGAVIPLPETLHTIDHPNNFVPSSELNSFLQADCYKYNILEF